MERRQYSPDEIEKIMAKIESLKETGLSTTAAAKQAGVYHTFYYSHRKAKGRKMKGIRKPKIKYQGSRIKVIDLPQHPKSPSTGQAMLILGSAEEIIRIARGIQ